jgi:DNA-binding protein H-NS
MPIAELIKLREVVDRLLTQRMKREKQALLKAMAAISRFESAPKQRPRQTTGTATEPKRRSKPKPKYKNPITGETWAGRGLQPRWLRKAIEAGHEPAEFRIPE